MHCMRSVKYALSEVMCLQDLTFWSLVISNDILPSQITICCILLDMGHECTRCEIYQSFHSGGTVLASKPSHTHTVLHKHKLPSWLDRLQSSLQHSRYCLKYIVQYIPYNSTWSFKMLLLSRIKNIYIKISGVYSFYFLLK